MGRIGKFLLLPAAAVAATAVVLVVSPSHDARDSILAAALAQTSVHWTSTARHGHRLTVITADVTRDSGTAHVAVTGATNSSVDYRLIGATLYLRNNTDAGKYGGRWIAIPASDAMYARLTRGLTLDSAIRDAVPAGTVKVTRTTAGGIPLQVVRGTPSGQELSLVAHATGTQLPIRFSWHLAGGDSGETLFSKWNEPVHVAAPANAIPIATVRGQP